MSFCDMRSARACVLLILTGCSIFGPRDVDYRQQARDELLRRKGLWTASGIHHYDFAYRRDCTQCALEATQPVTIHVRSDAITRVVDSLGNDVPAQPGTPWPTVDSLFQWTQLLLANKAFALEINFDTTYNFPSHVFGEDPGQSSVRHDARDLVVQAATAPAVASYLRTVPFSKSKSVSWRNR